MTENTTFTPGFYSTRSACDYDCIFTYEITRVSAKSVWIKTRDGEGEQRRGIVKSESGDYVLPEGSYSMCPVITPEKRNADEVEEVTPEAPAPAATPDTATEAATVESVELSAPVTVPATIAPATVSAPGNVYDVEGDFDLSSDQVVMKLSALIYDLFAGTIPSVEKVCHVIDAQLAALEVAFRFPELTPLEKIQICRVVVSGLKRVA